MHAAVSTAALASLWIYSITVVALLVGSPLTSTAVLAAAHFKFFLSNVGKGFLFYIHESYKGHQDTFAGLL